MSVLTNYKTSTYSGTSQDLANIFASLTVNNSFTGRNTFFNGLTVSGGIQHQVKIISSSDFNSAQNNIKYLELTFNDLGDINILQILAPNQYGSFQILLPEINIGNESTYLGRTFKFTRLYQRDTNLTNIVFIANKTNCIIPLNSVGTANYTNNNIQTPLTVTTNGYSPLIAIDGVIGTNNATNAATYVVAKASFGSLVNQYVWIGIY